MKFHLIITLFLLSFVSYSQSLPSSVDNSKEKYFPPIFSQIGNSCSQASSIGYVFTYEASPWRGGDDKDHIFFADMLKLFKEKLSIDTSRVFCCGFSFGAMFTYSLSLEFQNDLRAVACYAPANWNIYLPENKHLPLAYFSTTGTEDGLCKFVNSDERKQGGKYCVLTHIEDNGLKELPELPIATTPTHITTEFKGLPAEYPVMFGSFIGGHTENVKDPGSDVNWIAKETWDFFMRF